MKKIKYFILGIIFTLVITTAVPTLASSLTKTISILTGVSIYVDDVKLNPKDATGKPVEAFIHNGTTYLPVRAVADALGVGVVWEGPTKSVYLGKHKSETAGWAGTYKEVYTHTYGDKALSSELYSKEYIPTIKLNADGTYEYQTNWFYTMLTLKGTWGKDPANPNKINLSYQTGLTQQISFERVNDKDIKLLVNTRIQSEDESSTSTNGDIYRR